jgi:hypothetical protein
MALATTPFETAILRGMRTEGLEVRRILRIFHPLGTGLPAEVLFESKGNQAGTLWVDPSGKIIRGPVPGFGDPDEW